MNLKCRECGNIIETLPQHCGSDMVINEKTNELECWMGQKCGYMRLEDLICAKCAERLC